MTARRPPHRTHDTRRDHEDCNRRPIDRSDTGRRRDHEGDRARPLRHRSRGGPPSWPRSARPSIGDDEVLVRVRAASVDRGTWHLMTGRPNLMRIMGFGLRRPKQPNPGRSVAGTVEAVGRNVTAFEPGDEIYGTAEGSFAEYARADAGKLAPKPANLSFEQAAAVPVSGLTALQGVRTRPDRRRTEGADHRRLGWRGDVRGPDCQGLRCRGDRCVQHGEDGAGPRAGRRSRRRLHAGGLCRRPASLRRDPRHRRQQPALTSPAGAHSRRDGSSSWAARPRGGGSAASTVRSGRLLLSPLVSQKLGILTASENSADLSVLGELLESGKIIAGHRSDVPPR